MTNGHIVGQLPYKAPRIFPTHLKERRKYKKEVSSCEDFCNYLGNSFITPEIKEFLSVLTLNFAFSPHENGWFPTLRVFVVFFV
jgi:hypothetical protein